MTEKAILVLGGTGKTGRRVVGQLRQRGEAVRPASRSGAIRFDWDDESSWAPAVEGTRAVYLVEVESAIASMRSFSELAAAKGVQRLVLLSARAEESAEKRLEKEQAVSDARTQWTILRPTWYFQNFSETPMIRDPLLAGELALPAGDGLEPFIDADDIAAVAVAALTETGHNGQTYDLSGPESLSFGEAVAQIAQATGRELRYTAISGEEFVANPGKYSTVPGEAEMFAQELGFIAAGQTSHLSDGVQRALGREPRTFADFAKQAAASGVWDR